MTRLFIAVFAVCTLIVVAIFQTPSDAQTFQGWAAIIQVIISGITGFFLIQTFILQARTFEQQRQVTVMQSLEYRIKLQPFLEYQGVIRSSTNDNYYENNYILKFQVRRNNLQSLELQTFLTEEGKNFYTLNEPTIDIDKTWIPGEIIAIGVFFTEEMIQEVEQLHLDAPVLTVKFSYKDLLGNEYVSGIRYSAQTGVKVLPAKYSNGRSST